VRRSAAAARGRANDSTTHTAELLLLFVFLVFSLAAANKAS
jgi:hypothetical protein